MLDKWSIRKICDIIDVNPKEYLSKGKTAKKIPMDTLRPFCRDISKYELSEYSGGVKFRNGDTIMARITPCLENGKTAKVSILEDNEVGFGSTEYIVFRAIDGISDEDFIYYLVCSPIVREPAIKSMVGSSGRQRVQTDVLKNLKICVPDLETQCKIGSLLKSIDDKISLNTKINENLEQQAQAIFKSWFVDFEPFGGVMPDDWRIGTVLDLSKEIICGKTPSTRKKEYYGDYMPFITIPDMHNRVYTTTTERYLSELGANSQMKKTLPKNSICVSCIGTAGLVALVSTDSQTNQQINSIVPKEGYSSYYIFLLMQTFSEKINRLGQSGSTIVNLNKAQFGMMEALVPTVSSMNDFDSVAKPLFEKILANQQGNQRLATLRDTLLPKLMNGEIDVSEVEI